MVELCPTSRSVAWVKGYDKGTLDFRILRTRMRLRTALAQEALCTAKHFKVAVSSMRGKSACTPCLHPRFVHTRCLFRWLVEFPLPFATVATVLDGSRVGAREM